MRARFLVMLAALAATHAQASAYVPASRGELIEQLPSGTGRGNADTIARGMRALLQRDPNNLDIALRLAQLDVERARVESDPRQLGRAQATLAPWWDKQDAPVPVVLLRATILQSSHQFDAARTDLNNIVAREPANAQAWLTLATVQQVTGQYEDARASCGHVLALAASPVAIACQASLDALTGNAAQARDALQTSFSHQAALGDSPHVRSWLMTMLGEIDERLDAPTDAERWYRASLAADPTDAYTIDAYADFLLDQQRPDAVLALIPANTPADVLLLRRVIADRQLASPDAQAARQDLNDRFAALRARGDRVHLREEARFTLAVLDDPGRALELALDNWKVQKEPLDARIALECAIAARQPHAVDHIVRWLDETHLQGARIEALKREIGS